MLSQDLRRKFINYFKKEGHTVVPSAPVVPHDDPTLLFNNAGMNQFKDVFLGKTVRDYTKAVSSQKCIRVGGKHNDLDNVGHTTRHNTFFEMLGNFSFGDYFKKEAIKYAFDVTTNVFELPLDKIWVSVYKDDDEAYELWKQYIDEKHIVRFGEEENFWSMGDTGPCGPCSELLFDRGERFGKFANPHEDRDGERYFEFWNLVFMEYNREQTGATIPLLKKSIDTGAGLERVVSIKMDVDTVFATDILRGLISEIEKITRKKYDPSDKHFAPAFHVISDHIRALAFAIADGAQPSNVERGYVLRKILRRAVRYGRLLEMDEPFLAKLLPKLTEMMGGDYHELKQAQSRTAELLTLEEESFFRTLKRGGNILSQVINKSEEGEKKEISGEDAFKLKDTYGFPIEEILLIAKDEGLSVNLDTYQILEKEAKDKSRKAKATHLQTFEENIFQNCVEEHGASEFIGYDETEAEGTILAIVADGIFVEKLETGQEGVILLDKTPFYAEKGGQVGDKGELSHHEAHFLVHDCQSPFPDVIIHVGKLEKGTLLVGEPVVAKIDEKRRLEIEKHHTATHLLHWALQQVLGEHIRQGGSLVEKDRLRFDFTHHKALTFQELREVEHLVNEKIWENRPLATYELSFEEVQKKKDIKQFFGEKYGNIVRVVDIDTFSKELCGGTHVTSLGLIGFFKIAKESSIAKGVRRIEGQIGIEALKLTDKSEDQLLKLSEILETPLQKLEEKTSQMVEEGKKLKEEAKKGRKKYLNDLAATLMTNIKQTKTCPLLCAAIDITPDELPLLGNELMGKMTSGVLALAVKHQDRCQLLIKVSSDIVEKNIHANALIKEIAPLIQGGGGGKKDAAQAGGKNPQGIPQAFEKLESVLC